MSLLSRYIKEKEFDVRMSQRGLVKGLILQKELDAHSKSLEDDSENADYIEISSLMENNSAVTDSH